MLILVTIIINSTCINAHYMPGSVLKYFICITFLVLTMIG